MIFDSHAHYDDSAFDNDRDDLIHRLFNSDICGIINVGCNISTSSASMELASKYPLIWAAVGVHPQEADSVPPDYIDVLASFLKEKKVVAVGEIGLDYHYDEPSKEAQKIKFEKQVKLAKTFDVPVIIHDRDAHADTLEILKKYRPKGVVHCFSGGVDMAIEVVNLGMYVGLGGVVTFKNANKPVLVAKSVPLDRILLETDCPYLAPEPNRGSRCDSSMIKFTAEKIALERDMSVDELLKCAKENALRLFSKINLK